MFRCIVNEGRPDEYVIAAATREELDELVRKRERLGKVKTKRFFKIKADEAE